MKGPPVALAVALAAALHPCAAAEPLDLAALLKEAGERSPAIAAARSRVAAADALPGQAEAYPDPVAGVTIQNESFSRLTLGETEDSFLAFSWSQEVPWPGKRHLAGDVARGEVEVARRRADRIRRDLFSGIERGYVDLYRIDRTRSLLGGSRELLLAFIGTARARYESGEGILENVVKAQTELSRLDAELERNAQERLSAEAALKALVGRRGGETLGPAIALPETAGIPDAAAAQRESEEGAPEILEARAEVQREQARLDLARRQLKPDLTWSASYANRDGLDPMISGGVAFRLPLYRERRQLQAIAQAGSGVEAAGFDLESARLRAAAEAADLVARAMRAEALSRLYEEGVIPQARSALDSASTAYGVGRVDFLTLLNDLNALLAYQVELETQRADRVAALSALEVLTGRTLVLPDGANHE